MATNLTQFKKKVLKNATVRAEYDKLAPEYALINTIIARRQQLGWSQTELARRAGTKQPVISRLEQGETNPTIGLLQRVAVALNSKLEVSFR